MRGNIIKSLLEKLKTSIKHLQIIDDVVGSFNHNEKDRYLEIRKDIDDIDKKWEEKEVSLSEQLYVGGKKGGKYGYGRHMILADIIEYIFTGRLYHFFLGHKNDKNLFEKKSDFFKIILLIINQLLIWDSLTVEKDLRDQVLIELEKKIGKNIFFKDEDREEEYNNLLRIKEDIGFPTPIKDLPSIKEGNEMKKRLDEYMDSILPKTGGGLWNELIVYLSLLKTNVGYILPLLLTQRIYSIDKILKPPDFMIIDYDEKIYSILVKENELITNIHDQKLIGVEVGGGKEFQSGTFSGETKQPTTTTQNTNIPPRCPICGKWILFCKKVINDFSDMNNPITYRKKHIKCLYHCKYYKPSEILRGKCPDIQYFGNIGKNNKDKLKIIIKYSGDYHYHYSCINKLNDPVAFTKICKARREFKIAIKKQNNRFKINSRNRSNVLKSSYPYISGVEVLEMYSNKEKMFCFGKQYIVEDKRNCILNNCAYSKECYIMTEFIKEKLKKKNSTDL